MNTEQVHAAVHDFVLDLHPDAAATPPAADATFDELGIDSMSLVDLLVKLERDFDVAIPDDDLPRIATVGDLAAYVTAASPL